MRGLENQVILVTGAARGLGEAICTTLAAEGAVLVACDIREGLVQSLAHKLTEQGGKSTAVTLDAGSSPDVENTLNSVREEFGRLDAVINNAGIDVTCSIEEMSVDDWDRIILTNLRGPFLLSKHAFPIMKAQGGGSIINIASTAAERTWANASAYHSSRWGLVGFSHALHVEGRKENIKVSAVICGGMKTPFLFERFPDLDPDLLQDPLSVAEAVKFVLMQPPGTVIPEIMVLPMRETSRP